MTFTATYDGRTLVPTEPVELPVGATVKLTVADEDVPPLMKLLGELEKFPVNEDWPADGAANYKHYLYGLPKQV